ncbi:LuxR C-terminal-related transcriptional regulator [Tenacibaculum sp. FZY0031]|uniref:helix-turn-helix transcriptional regulator n=1 Tax=Tenacibaculum sp. FZY0031 TaxID=3116648 RepID=UPI002EAB86D6|nr:LuxR C-terminal-related transcriptional regulator [Tenacibaculum sp. FZY0031]
MKKDHYIIVASDTTHTVSRIVSELDDLRGYSTVTVNSIKLLKEFLHTITPKLIILSFKNNNIEIKYLFNSFSKVVAPVLCLTNRYETVDFSLENTPVMIQTLENSLGSKHLLCNVKSILSLSSVHHKSSLNTNRNGEPSFLTENKNLARYVLELDQKKALLKSMMERIKELSLSVDYPTRGRLNSIINNIKVNTRTNHWDDFKVYFENINPGFIKELTHKFPCLTVKDIKYCCYLKMNMSNEDIRYILGISKESVRTHKYRLKKKMILEKKQDLKSFIRSF